MKNDIKPMSERSEAEKSFESIVFGNMHEFFWKEGNKYINIQNKSTVTYFKTSLADS